MKFRLNTNGIIEYKKVLFQRLQKSKKILVDKVKTNLQTFSPVKTGFLRDHYSIVEDQNTIYITNQAPYLKYVNDGTIHQTGQHFVQKSITLALNQFRDINNIK